MSIPSPPADGVDARTRLERARDRLAPLRLYPAPPRLDGVRVVHAPRFFRLPRLRRYRGYTLSRTILLARPLADTSDDLLAHELCHVWQMQHRPLHVVWTWLTTRYERNPYELEARRAVAATRSR